MNYDTVERHGKPFVLVPKADYERIEAALEVRAYDRAKAKNQELVPAALVDRLLAGMNPIRVWREYRKLTLEQLAGAVAISKPYLSQIENGLRRPTVDVLGGLARALGLDLDQLAPAASKRAVRPRRR